MSEQDLISEIDSLSKKQEEFQLTLKSLRQEYYQIESDLIEVNIKKKSLLEDLRLLRTRKGLRADGSSE